MSAAQYILEYSQNGRCMEQLTTSLLSTFVMTLLVIAGARVRVR